MGMGIWVCGYGVLHANSSMWSCYVGTVFVITREIIRGLSLHLARILVNS